MLARKIGLSSPSEQFGAQRQQENHMALLLHISSSILYRFLGSVSMIGMLADVESISEALASRNARASSR